MTPEQIEQMRADMAAGTPGPWVYEYTCVGHTVRQPDCMNHIVCSNSSGAPETDARRIARVPDMESEILRRIEREAELQAEILQLRAESARMQADFVRYVTVLPADQFAAFAKAVGADDMNGGDK